MLVFLSFKLLEAGTFKTNVQLYSRFRSWKEGAISPTQLITQAGPNLIVVDSGAILDRPTHLGSTTFAV